MGETEKASQKRVMTPVEIAEFLRNLAADFERGGVGVGKVALAPPGSLKVRLQARKGKGRAGLSMKVKWEEEAAAGEEDAGAEGLAGEGALADGGRPNYKKMKKRLRGTFKRIREGLAAGSLPAEELVANFERDAALMMHFPHKGDSTSLAEFEQLARQFGEAARQGNLEETRQKAALLRCAEKDCHDRYK